MINYRDPKAKALTSCFGVLVVAVSKVSKSNVRFLGRSLIEHSVRTALASGATEVVVATSSEAADETRRALRGLPVRVINNDENRDGLGDAISLGVSAFSSALEAVVITLGNRPGITANHLKQLASSLSIEQTIVASSYDGVVGVPCAFAKTEIPYLIAFSGNEGARELVRTRCTALIYFEAANIRLEVQPIFNEISSDLPVASLKWEPSHSIASRAPPTSTGYGVSAHRNTHPSLALEHLWPELKHSHSSNFSSSSRSSRFLPLSFFLFLRKPKRLQSAPPVSAILSKWVPRPISI